MLQWRLLDLLGMAQLFNWKFCFIFVIAWFWWFATESKLVKRYKQYLLRNSEKRFSPIVSQHFFENCNRNFCVKIEIQTEVSPKYCVKNRICVNKENWTQFCQNILLEKPISLENEKRNQILLKIIVEKRNFSEYGNPGRSLLVKSNFTWNLTNEKKFYVKKSSW